MSVEADATSADTIHSPHDEVVASLTPGDRVEVEFVDSGDSAGSVRATVDDSDGTFSVTLVDLSGCTAAEMTLFQSFGNEQKYVPSTSRGAFAGCYAFRIRRLSD